MKIIAEISEINSITDITAVIITDIITVYQKGDVIPDVISPTVLAKIENNESIYQQLIALDKKRIRAVCEGDSVILANLNSMAVGLRAHLLK